MLIIPAIDLRAGVVVRANGKERQLYPPLRSYLCRGTEPQAVISGLLRLFPFPVIYLADLDALEHGLGQIALIRALRKAFPQLEFWIDAGAVHGSGSGRSRRVLGSESGLSPEELKAQPESILSLDFRDHALLGDEKLLQAPQSWPRRVILMDLDRVGRAMGPNLPLWEQIQALAAPRQLYAAGGIRGVEDLQRLHERGAAGALLTGALHDRQRITEAALSRLADISDPIT